MMHGTLSGRPLLVLFATWGGACTGQIGDEPGIGSAGSAMEGAIAPLPTSGTTIGTTAASGGTTTVGIAPVPTSGTTTGGTGPDPAACAVDPGAAPLRRLSRREYVQTVKGLTGVDLEAAGTLSLARETVVDGFNNNAETFSFSSPDANAYMEAAELVALRVTATPERRAQVLGCEPTGAGAAACFKQLATGFARKAYRRPVTGAEVQALVDLAAKAQGDPDVYAPVRLMIRAVLQSPKFLLRVEVGRPDSDRPGLVRLTGHERATRLSYLFLGTAPEPSLLDAADAGGLDTAAGVEATARQLLADPRARDGVRTFFAEWLTLGKLDRTERDPKAFPLWSPSLRQAMQGETTQVIDDLVWNGRNVQGLLTARETFVNADLARLYQVPSPPAGSTFERRSVAGVPRAGILTHASFLTITGEDAVTPIRRGLYIRETLLCEEPPPPPTNVPDLPAPKAGQTPRELLEQHRANPACAACHALLDPLGFGLSRYDEIGAYHVKDEQGRPIADDGVLSGADSPAFNGAVELATKLGGAPAFPACVASRFGQFALARGTTPADGCWQAQIQNTFKKAGYDFRALLLAFVRSDAFLYRRPKAGSGI